RFEPSRLYAGRPTFVFGAPVQSDGKCLGGIAAVFDTAPQVTEMLRAALPRDERGDVSAGSIALFVDGDGRAIGSSDPTARVPRDLLEQVGQLSGTRGAEVVRAEGSYYALACMAERVGGEHPGIGAHAVLLTPLGHVPPRT